MKNSKKFLNYAAVSSLLAICVHIYLTKHFYELKMGALDGTSFCNISSTFNCDTVTASSFSSLFDIPIALWGAITNLIILLLILISRYEMTADLQKSKNWTLYLSVFSAFVSLTMGLISMTQLGTYCLFCIAAYLLSFINVALVVSSVGLKNISLTDFVTPFTQQRWILGFLISIPTLAFASNLMILDSFGFSKIDVIIKEKVEMWKVSPENKFDLTKGLIHGENPQAKMVIVEFADYRCPHCKFAYPTLEAFASSHPKDVKLIFKPFPLDGVCNKALQGGDGVGCDFSYLTFCAEKVAQKGWMAHRLIFDNQLEYRHETKVSNLIPKISAALAIPQASLESCMASDEIRDLIAYTANEGVQAKIAGTPSIFVNGKILEGGQMIPILEATLKAIK